VAAASCTVGWSGIVCAILFLVLGFVHNQPLLLLIELDSVSSVATAFFAIGRIFCKRKEGTL
jgi:hypothetical protein